MPNNDALAQPHDEPDMEMDQPAYAQRIAQISRFIALSAAWVATCGSLFFSEALGWIPCSLCWYQRILMYPISILIAVGLIRRDPALHTYVLPFSMGGAVVALYHYLIQKTDWLPPPLCSVGVPCTVDYINWLGFITIPFLALTAFVIISLALGIAAFYGDDGLDADGEPRPGLMLERITVVAVAGGIALSFFIAAKLR